MSSKRWRYYLASKSLGCIQWRLVAHLIGWANQYFIKLINPPKILIYHQIVLPKGRSFTANSVTKAAVLNHYSVFLVLRRATYKLSSEVGCGEVTNPKWPVRERDRQSPTALQCYYMYVYVETGVVSFYSNTAICRAK